MRRGLSRLLETVVDGQGLDRASRGAVLLGKTLAEELGVVVGDEVAVVTQAADGSLGNELWRVRGIIRTGLATLDLSLAVVAIGDLQELMALGPERIHQVVARLADPDQARRDRQLTATVSVTGELTWNGFGATRPDEYPRIASADRVRRGEVNALGRCYFGGSVSWQAHPLLMLTGSALVNLGDGSALLLPHADWSLSVSTSLVFYGAINVYF